MLNIDSMLKIDNSEFTFNCSLFKDDPEWLALAESLESKPMYGSADWADYTYANHNDPWEPAVFNNIAALRANTATNYYKKASHLRSGNIIMLLGTNTPGDGGGGLYEYNNMSYIADNGSTVIAPESRFTGGRGRWISKLRLVQPDSSLYLQPDGSSLYNLL